MSNDSVDQVLSFEAAFKRLEEILQAISCGEVSLDSAIQLYEEADRLINQCGKRLNAAEQRIEILIKNRQGELSLDHQGQPKTQPLTGWDSGA